jgi:osmotically-inducible protein OsmY
VNASVVMVIPIQELPSKTCLTEECINSAIDEKDQMITQDLQSAFQQDPKHGFITQGIMISTRNGVVTLTGQVFNTAYRDQLVEKANHISGVRVVKNHLIIGGS